MNIHSYNKILSIILFSTISIVGLSTAMLYVFPKHHNNNVSALTYSNESKVSFTFSPMISISISNNTIDIPTLAPGTTAESNPISITVDTNTAYGYSLYADVGNSTDYNTDSLVYSSEDNSDNFIPAVFTNIATNANLSQLDTDNTWGYSYKLSNKSAWPAYNGLPLYSTTDSHTSTSNPAILIDTKYPEDSKSIDFKIAARASTAQASGTYNNVINFYAVGKPEPPLYMQDTATIKATLVNIGEETQAIDNRDGKTYWIAKQADGNIWMTQNLDLCIGCEGTATLTSQNTDLNEASRYINIGGVMTWVPYSTAITAKHPINDTTVVGWSDSDTAPYSAEGGERYIYDSGSNNEDVLYNSLTECTSSGLSADKCLHYHVGNYYNWSAAVASNDSGYLTTGYEVAANSICPAGWRMPKGTVGFHNDTASTCEFGQLFYSSGVTNSLTAITYSAYGFNKIRTSPIYFTRGGEINKSGSLDNLTSTGYYWSSTSDSMTGAYGSFFSSGFVTSAGSRGSSTRPIDNYRYHGYTVRCMMR